MQTDKNNKRVYESAQGETLVVSSDFPPEILEYLDDESFLVSSIANRSSGLIEIGCMWGRYTGIAIENGCAYLGMDISSSYIERARLEFPSAENRNIRFLEKDFGCSTNDILDHLRSVGVSPGCSTAIFPFNVLGNITNIDQAIETIRSLEIPTFIFGYKDCANSINILKDYYRSAGIPIDRVADTNDRIVFESSEVGFRSITYRTEWFLTSFPHATIHDFGALGRVVAINADEVLTQPFASPDSRPGATRFPEQ